MRKNAEGAPAAFSIELQKRIEETWRNLPRKLQEHFWLIFNKVLKQNCQGTYTESRELQEMFSCFLEMVDLMGRYIWPAIPWPCLLNTYDNKLLPVAIYPPLCFGLFIRLEVFSFLKAPSFAPRRLARVVFLGRIRVPVPISIQCATRRWAP